MYRPGAGPGIMNALGILMHSIFHVSMVSNYVARVSRQQYIQILFSNVNRILEIKIETDV
jgi:hypothetical protein